MNTYLAPAVVSSDGLWADLGKFGRIAVRFTPGGVRRVASRCGRGAHLFRDGRFTGVVEFAGEEGYTEVDAPALDVEPFFEDIADCIGAHVWQGTGKGALLEVYSARARFTASQNRPGAKVRVTATTEDRYGEMTVGRVVSMLAPPTAFRWHPNFDRGRVEPPFPFAGHAIFRDLGHGKTRWEGNLRVDFPGEMDYRLTSGPHLAWLRRGGCELFTAPEVSRPSPPLACF